jgi:pimeloyl-ACP methyl ester carboxylesterase
MWRTQIAELQNKYRVIVPNLRGFGGTSAFDGEPSIARMADDVNVLFDGLGLREPVVLGGLSMGGYVAFAFARSYAARVRGLILADTRAEADTPETKATRDKTIAFARGHSPREVVDQMLPRLFCEKTRLNKPEVVAEVRDIASVQTPAAIVAALQAMRDRPDSTPSLASIVAPSLVIVGADDVVTPPAASQTIAHGIRGAELVTIADAGHMSNMEQPKRFNEAVDSFLSRLK